jgi:purine-nucleoside phosphorylase
MTEALAPSPGFAALVEAARSFPPEVALVLGSGMSDVARSLAVWQSVSFGEVPGLSPASVAGHRGRLSLGDWAGKRALVFEGRLHHYEGHSWRDVLIPVQTAHALGAGLLLMTNAAGGIHDLLGAGSLMAIRDHIEWTRPYCWRQPGPGGVGPPRVSPYSARLLQLLLDSGCELGTPLHQGTYAALTGPNYETPAEIRALKAWGADAVGMSTAREVQAGHDLGMECAAVSCVTNRAAGLGPGAINHGEVLTTAATQIPRLAALVGEFLRRV